MDPLELGQKAREVEFTTSLGNFTIELYRDHAPKTCINIASLGI